MKHPSIKKLFKFLAFSLIISLISTNFAFGTNTDEFDGLYGPVFSSLTLSEDSGDYSGSLDVEGTANIDGDTDLGATLDVAGATNLNNILNVDGATDLDSTLTVEGTTDLNSTLTVDGASDLNSTLNVDGDTIISGFLDIETHIINSLTNIVKIIGSLEVSSNATIQGDVNIVGNIDINGAIKDSVDNNIVLSPNLSIEGIIDALLSIKNTEVNMPVLIDDDLQVNGDLLINETVEAAGTTVVINDALRVTDGISTTSFSAASIDVSDISISNNVDVQNNINNSNSDTVIVDDNLQVNGDISANNLNSARDISATGSLDVSENININNTIYNDTVLNGTNFPVNINDGLYIDNYAIADSFGNIYRSQSELFTVGPFEGTRESVSCPNGGKVMSCQIEPCFADNIGNNKLASNLSISDYGKAFSLIEIQSLYPLLLSSISETAAKNPCLSVPVSKTARASSYIQAFTLLEITSPYLDYLMPFYFAEATALNSGLYGYLYNYQSMYAYPTEDRDLCYGGLFNNSRLLNIGFYIDAVCFDPSTMQTPDIIEAQELLQTTLNLLQ